MSLTSWIRCCYDSQLLCLCQDSDTPAQAAFSITGVCCKLGPLSCTCAAQVLSVTLATIKDCEEFKQQYTKYEFLWKQDLQQTLQVGLRLPKHQGGLAGSSTRDRQRVQWPATAGSCDVEGTTPGRACVTLIDLPWILA